MGFLLLTLGICAGAAVTWLLARRARSRHEERSQDLRREEQDALVGTIASGLAHEIRNPLSTLRMNLQLLREDWENPITEREIKGIKKIDVLLRETQRLEKVLSDFLDWAKGHALRLERTNLNQLVSELLDYLSPQAEQTGIRFRRNLAPDLPPVEADPNLIRQALLNLVLNAQQATGNGGEVALSTSANGQFVRIAVSDNGPGIAPEHRDQLFNLYFSTKPGGTGLGLPVVKRIIEEHKGTIEVDCPAPRGATFTLCLKKSPS